MKYILDSVDKGILELLQKNSRLTHKEIAAKLNKSVTPIHVRIRRLQDEGFIKKYTAILDPKLISKQLTVFTQIQLKEHHQNALVNFMEEAVKIVDVMECYHMTGAFDILLKVCVKDMEEYTAVISNKLSNLPHVGTVQSVFVLTEAKRETAYSL